MIFPHDDFYTFTCNSHDVTATTDMQSLIYSKLVLFKIVLNMLVFRTFKFSNIWLEILMPYVATQGNLAINNKLQSIVMC